MSPVHSRAEAWGMGTGMPAPGAPARREPESNVTAVSLLSGAARSGLSGVPQYCDLIGRYANLDLASPRLATWAHQPRNRLHIELAHTSRWRRDS